MTTQIQRKVRYLVRKFNTRNPYEIAEAIGARIYSGDLGDVAGFYQYVKRHRCIYINSAVDDHMAKIVMAHELGHAVLHRKENCYFIDKDESMMNVAVSRAKDAFIVFGDRGCFSERETSATYLLGHTCEEL